MKFLDYFNFLSENSNQLITMHQKKVFELIKTEIFSIRNELIINLRFWLDLFAASLVKKPRDSAAIPTFFALLATKISNPKFLIY